MSSIEKMELVNIVGLLKYLDDTLIQCIRSGVFHIEQSSQIAEESGAAGFVNLHEQTPTRICSSKSFPLIWTATSCTKQILLPQQA